MPADDWGPLTENPAQGDIDTERLAEFARQAERALPDDVDYHLWAWQTVARQDPCHAEAQAALIRLRRRQTALRITARLDQVLPAARRAAAHHDLVQLTALWDEVRDWQAQQEAGLLDAELGRCVAEVAQAVGAVREATLRRLTRVSDLLQTQDYREAYRQARIALERGILKLYDPATEADVDTTTACRDARERYLTALRQLAVGRLAQAEAVALTDPSQALDLLQEARAQLGDDLLNVDDRVALRPQREMLDRQAARTQRRLERYRDAHSLVGQALAKGGPEALTLLRQARHLYPDYPDLAAYLASAERALAGPLVARLAAAAVEARRQTARQEFDAAARTLAAARAEAAQQAATLGLETGPTEALAEVVEVEQGLARAEGAYRQLLALLADVDDQLRRAAEGDAQAPAHAERLLATLTPDERAQAVTRRRLAALAALR